MKERIIVAVVDTRHVTLYKEDGSTIVLQQGDERLAAILSTANIAAWTRGQVVEIELVPDRENHLAQFERKAGGVKLFRVLKDKVKSLFGATTGLAPNARIGTYGQFHPVEKIDTAAEKAVDAVNEILAGAESVSAPSFDPGKTLETETIVAVTPAGQLIPGVEALESHMAHAVATDRTVGVNNFMSRLGAIVSERNHTVQELLNFCQKGDLQFTDDGAILAYKVLRRKDGHPGVYVDCHSGKVPQKVGSFVCMDAHLVDPSKRTECSSGLHIARRAYIQYFSGNVITLVRIEPEDVIAVPYGEPDKMRVRGYLILAEINDHDHNELRNNRPVKTEETLRLLGQAISGKHVARLEEVKIGGPKGTNVVIRNLLGGLVAVPKVTADPVKPVESIEPKEVRTDAKPIDPRAVNKTTAKVKADQKPKQNASVTKAGGGQPQAVAKKAVDKSAKAPAKTNATPNVESDLSVNQKEALRLAREGVLSMREIGRRTELSDRACARLLDKFGRKAPE